MMLHYVSRPASQSIATGGEAHSDRTPVPQERVCGGHGVPSPQTCAGTPSALERAEDLVFGQGAGAGEVARISFVLPLSEPRETGGETA